jgi:hypothetical protein
MNNFEIDDLDSKDHPGNDVVFDDSARPQDGYGGGMQRFDINESVDHDDEEGAQAEQHSDRGSVKSNLFGQSGTVVGGTWNHATS